MDGQIGSSLRIKVYIILCFEAFETLPDAVEEF